MGRNNTPGHFIAIEGPDGVGKTTALQGLAEQLRAETGREVLCIREPGGTELSERVRDVLVRHGGGDGVVDLLLFSAARRQLLLEKVRPALERGAIVLSDRFILSTYAYQGGGMGVPDETISIISEIATDGTVPDLTLLLHLDEEERKRRMADRGNPTVHYEREEFLARVRKRYQELATMLPGVRVVSASGTPAEVVQRLMDNVRDVIRAPRVARGRALC